MNIYEKQARMIRDERRMTEDGAHIAWKNALYSDDGLYNAFVAYQAEMIKAAQKKQNDEKSAAKRVEAEMKRLGLDRSMFEPPYNCDKCRDTGMVGGRYCSCVIGRVIKADKENLSLPLVDFDEAEKTAPSGALKKAYSVARTLIAEYPDCKKPFFVLAGASGTGKTHLAAAVATSFMKRGASVVTVTAFSFVRRALEYHTQFSIPDYTDRFTPMLDCDVLAIDDLGTESTLKNVTKEYLYTVVNERWRSRKPTVITTNLNAAELMNRYGESISSRMLDKSCSQILHFGNNAKNARIE